MSVSRLDVLTGLRNHPQSERLCARVADVCLSAARAKRADWLCAQTVSAEPGPLTALSPTEAETEFGNVLSILDRGAQTPVEWCVLAAALALSVARQWPTAPRDSGPSPTEREQLGLVAWLAAHTGCNAWAFLSLDDTCGEGPLWTDVEKTLDEWGAAEQLALAVGTMEAGSDPALRLKAMWLERSGNPAIASLLETSTTSPWLDGQVGSPRTNGLLFALQVVTGYALLKTLFASFSRYVLWRRRQARLRVSPRGVEISSKTHVLGQVFKETSELIPLADIQEIRRETRYSGAGLYVGLGCLLLGSLVGSGLVLDGLRVPGTSPSLLTVGAGLILLGLIVDFALSHWTKTVAGRGVLVFKRSGGPSVLIHDLEPTGPAELIERISRLGGFRAARFATKQRAD
jgi:hypothetical protein